MRVLAWTCQKGLSLVEMMIALLLGAVVSVGVIQLFGANSDTYDLMQGQSRMQESARFSLSFISRAVQEAGYKGCFSTTNDVYSTIQPPTNIPYEFNVLRGLQGYDGQNATTWLPALTDLDTAFVTGNAIDTSQVLGGTDVLTVRYASQNGAQLIADMPTSSEDVQVEIPSTGLEFALNDLVLISDCEKSTVFRITTLTQDSPAAGDATIGHDTDDVDATRNSVTKLAEVNTYDQDAVVAAIRTNTFFIAPGTGVNNVGDTPLSLWRKYGTDAPVELVEGIEDLQILYGVDSDNDGTPNQYTTANLVTDYGQVVTVRITVTANSVDDVGGTSTPTHGCIASGGEQKCINGVNYDGLVRRTFHQTVQVRNKG